MSVGSLLGRVVLFVAAAACAACVAASPGPPAFSATAPTVALQPHPEPGSAAAPSRVEAPAALSGRLPPEVIQRVVREHFEEFRRCYEAGLGRDATLSGRVNVRFVISRQGTVASASDGGSSLPDAQVRDCVINAFKPLEFPKPENGTVTVVYPIMLAPG